MRLQNGLVILLTAMLLNLSLSAQSVNDKVTKDNLNSAFLSSLILERINEIRSYKKASDLRANKICQSVAVNHVDYMARNNKLTKEQEADGFVTTIDRLKSYLIWENVLNVLTQSKVKMIDQRVNQYQD